MISIDLKVGEKLQIGDAIVRLEQKSGQLARLVIDADSKIPVRKLANASASMRLIAEKGVLA